MIKLTLRASILMQENVSRQMRTAQQAVNRTVTSLREMDKQLKKPLTAQGAERVKKNYEETRKSANDVAIALKETERLQKQLTDEAKRTAEAEKDVASRSQNISSGFSSANVGAQKLLGTVVQIASAVGGVLGIQKVAEISDTVANANSRLDLANDGYRTRDEFKQDIYQSSLRSRSNYMENQQSIAKLGILAPDAFNNNNEIIRFNELMNKQFKIGGASTQEQSSAMYQLTQAMASGKLQGDEYRSIVENAPLLAQALTSAFEPLGYSLKEAAKDGLITSEVIKNSLFSVAQETEARFQQMPMTISDHMTQIGSFALQKFDPVLQKINEFVNSPTFQNGVNWLMEKIGAAATWVYSNFDYMKQGALNFINEVKRVGSNVANMLKGPLQALGSVAQFAWNNWTKILPPILAVIGTMKAYQLAQLAVTKAKIAWNAVQGFGTYLKGLATAAHVVFTGTVVTETGAVVAATGAQWALNAAMLACPILAIVSGIGLLVGAMSAFSGATDESTEKTKTWAEEQRAALAEREKQIEDNIATDMAAAEQARVLANEFDQLAKQSNRSKEDLERMEGITQQLNQIIPNATFVFKNEKDAIEDLRKTILATAEAFYTYATAQAYATAYQAKLDAVATSNVEAIERERELKSNITNIEEKNKALQIPGSTITVPISPLDKKLLEGYDKGISDSQKIQEDNEKLMKQYAKEVLSYTNEANKYFQFETNTDPYIAPYDPKGIKEDTAAIRDTLELTHEDLKYLRDIAEREVVNKYTTAEVNVSFGDVNNNINTEADLDGIEERIATSIMDAVNSSAEGLHH